MVQPLDEKLARLEALLRTLAPVVLGFSGGVDSTFLAAVCARAIPEDTLLVHLDSPFVSTPERSSCAAFAEGTDSTGCTTVRLAPQLPVLAAITLAFDPSTAPGVVANGPDRCYRCKQAGFTRVIAAARELEYTRGLPTGTACVLDGSNADDAAATDRPGMRALAELGVRSPLAEAGFTKAEERALLQAWSIPVWNLPAGACLATRVATGEPITAEKLACVRACEDYLHELGCTQVRARIEGGVLRIEASSDDLARITRSSTADEAASAPANTKRDSAASTQEIPIGTTAQIPATGIGDAAAQFRLTENIYSQLRTLAQENGITSVFPHARPYRRGSMNR